jgi:hypothetical protein
MLIPKVNRIEVSSITAILTGSMMMLMRTTTDGTVGRFVFLYNIIDRKMSSSSAFNDIRPKYGS